MEIIETNLRVKVRRRRRRRRRTPWKETNLHRSILQPRIMLDSHPRSKTDLRLAEKLGVAAEVWAPTFKVYRRKTSKASLTVFIPGIWGNVRLGNWVKKEQRKKKHSQGMGIRNTYLEYMQKNKCLWDWYTGAYILFWSHFPLPFSRKSPLEVPFFEISFRFTRITAQGREKFWKFDP